MDCIVPWNSPGQYSGVGSLSLLQWIFQTQDLYLLSPSEFKVAYYWPLVILGTLSLLIHHSCVYLILWNICSSLLPKFWKTGFLTFLLRYRSSLFSLNTSPLYVCVKYFLAFCDLSIHSLESESEVTQSCLTLCDPMDCHLSGSSVQARVLSGLPLPSPGDLPDLGIKPGSPAL